MKEILLQRQNSLQGGELKKHAAAQEAVGLCGHGGWEVFRQKYWPKWDPLHFSDIEAPLCVCSTCGHCMNTEPGMVPYDLLHVCCMGQQHVLSSHLAMGTGSQKELLQQHLWDPTVVGRDAHRRSRVEQSRLYLLEQWAVNAETWKSFAGECKGLWRVTERGSGVKVLEKSLSLQCWEQISAERVC